MICQVCGATIADKAIVCYRCGAPTAAPAAGRPAAAARRSRWPGLLTLVAGLMLALLSLVRPDLINERVGIAVAVVVGAIGASLLWRARPTGRRRL